MKRPAPIVYLFGNPLSVVALVIAALYLAYAWWAAQGSGALAFIALLVASYSFKASDQLSKYNHWNREWNAMEGRASGARGGGTKVSNLRALIGIVALGAAFIFVLNSANTPGMRVAAVLIGLALAVAVVGTVMRARRKSTKPLQAARDVAVTVCLPPMKAAPTLAQARAAVPGYCKPLFGGQR
jgi:Flp pilus assembly protein TadB